MAVHLILSSHISSLMLMLIPILPSVRPSACLPARLPACLSASFAWLTLSRSRRSSLRPPRLMRLQAGPDKSGSSFRMRRVISSSLAEFSMSKGCAPQSKMYMTTPKLHMSAAASHGRRCPSGASASGGKSEQEKEERGGGFTHTHK